MYTLEDFITLLEKLILFFDDITDVEQTKLEAVKEKNLEQLNTCMKEEQAYLLQFRGFDKKREEIQKALGFENLSFSQIIPRIEDTAYQAEFQELYETLKESMEYYQHVQHSAKTLIEVNLHSINKILEQFPALGSNDIYASDGQFHRSHGNTTFTNKRI